MPDRAAPPEADFEIEIVVTPEMIKAGLGRMRELQEAGVSLDYLATEVFLAMSSKRNLKERQLSGPVPSNK